jgi:hypothetical protein
MSHTPGPWKVVSSNQIGRASAEFYIWSAQGDQRSPAVAHVKHSTKRPTQANARLIAAAPEMLAALENALSDAEKGGFCSQTFDDVRAAIAKARGQ